jgi:hypothetical protein
LHAPQVFTGTERPWDLHIDSTTMTVLAMDGRHQWLDIEKLVCTLLYSIFSGLIWKCDRKDRQNHGSQMLQTRGAL